jgi:hypothetical protein
MNWDAFGAIGEVIGAAAVVISLVYVSIQVRSGTKALQTTTRDSVFKSVQEWNLAVMADPRLGWIFQSGSREFERLGDEDRARYLHVMYSFFKVFENIYLHHLDGVVPKNLWDPNRTMLTVYAASPGGRKYWEERKAAFDPRFNAVMEALKPGPLAPGHKVSQLQPETDDQPEPPPTLIEAD